MSRRIDVAVPLMALVISFVVVLLLGRAFATGTDGTEPGQQPTQPPSSPAAPTTPVASPVPTPTVNRFSLTITDLAQMDPAPGLLEVRAPDATHERRICMLPGLTAGWKPETAADWSEETGTLCRAVTANQPDGHLVISWVRR